MIADRQSLPRRDRDVMEPKGACPFQFLQRSLSLPLFVAPSIPFRETCVSCPPERSRIREKLLGGSHESNRRTDHRTRQRRTGEERQSTRFPPPLDRCRNWSCDGGILAESQGRERSDPSGRHRTRLARAASLALLPGESDDRSRRALRHLRRASAAGPGTDRWICQRIR